MENLKIYNSLKTVSPEFLKTITAGRLKGMSDIKPQWRIQKITECFGPCGFGWKLQNVTFEYVTKDNEVVCNCRLEFLYKVDNEWSEPIPGTGGSKFSTVESKGVYVSDEAEKMAMTDAISVATKFIGLASDIYMGYGGKYESQESDKKTLPQLKLLKHGTKAWDQLTERVSKGETITKEELKKFFDIKEVEKELETLNIF